MKIASLRTDGSTLIWAMTVWVILFTGDPDLLDAIIKYVMSLSGGGE